MFFVYGTNKEIPRVATLLIKLMKNCLIHCIFNSAERVSTRTPPVAILTDTRTTNDAEHSKEWCGGAEVVAS